MAEAQTDTIRFAVIGLGKVGRRHARLIRRNPETELAAGCDIQPLENLGLEDWSEPFFPDLESLLDSGIEFDVACICTPNGLHAPQALAVLKAGHHVVIEKPMGLSKAACEQVIFESLKVGKHVFCVMQNRYSPPSVWLKEVMDQHLLGEIHQVEINCFWNRDERYYQPPSWRGTQDLDGGTLFTQFSHFIDIMYWLFGDIEDIQARFANFTHQHSIQFEDSGIIHFRFVNGGMGSINYSTAVWDRNLESSLLVVGSQGSIKVGGQYMDKVEYCHVEGYEMPELPPANPANDYNGYKGSAANHSYVIQNVADVLKGRTAINTNALEGMKVVEIIERIYQQRGDL